jgi:hypothetical protein
MERGQVDSRRLPAAHPAETAPDPPPSRERRSSNASTGAALEQKRTALVRAPRDREDARGLGRTVAGSAGSAGPTERGGTTCSPRSPPRSRPRCRLKLTPIFNKASSAHLVSAFFSPLAPPSLPFARPRPARARPDCPACARTRTRVCARARSGDRAGARGRGAAASPFAPRFAGRWPRARGRDGAQPYRAALSQRCGEPLAHLDRRLRRAHRHRSHQRPGRGPRVDGGRAPRGALRRPLLHAGHPRVHRARAGARHPGGDRAGLRRLEGRGRLPRPARRPGPHPHGNRQRAARASGLQRRLAPDRGDGDHPLHLARARRGILRAPHRNPTLRALCGGRAQSARLLRRRLRRCERRRRAEQGQGVGPSSA